MTDKELIRKVQNGNKEILNLIVEKYYNDIYRFCLYLIADEFEAYDITQTVFLKFIQYVDSYKYKNLKGYLLIIARNLCRDYWTYSNKSLVTYDSEQLDIVAIDNKMDEVVNHVYLYELLQKLSKEQREVIVLHLYEDMKFKDIAYMIGVNGSTIKSRYQAGITRMKNIAEMEEVNNER
ncbi:MAG: RNA polymerase sigma factor [Lachnospiraceae bacterium]